MFKKVICIICLTLFVCATFSSCNKKANEENQKNTSSVISTSDTLSEYEKEIVNGLILASKTFDNPKSIQILGVTGDMKTESTIINISSTNMFGETMEKSYTLYIRGDTVENYDPKYPNIQELEEYIGLSKNNAADIDKINKALKEYWDTHEINEDELDDYEKNILHALAIATSEFKNPSSAKLIKAGNDVVNPDAVIVILSGTNSLGGTETFMYRLFIDNELVYTDDSTFIKNKIGNIYRLTDNEIEVVELNNTFKQSHINIAGINKALNAYWNEMGVSY